MTKITIDNRSTKKDEIAIGAVQAVMRLGKMDGDYEPHTHYPGYGIAVTNMRPDKVERFVVIDE